MNLFKLEDERLDIEPEVLTLKPFKELWKKYRNKQHAMEDMSYNYFMFDHKSDFAHIIDEEERSSIVIQNVISRDNWEPSHLGEASTLFKELQKTLSSELLESAKVAAYKLKQYFNEIDLKELDRNGKPVHDAKKLVSTIGSIGETITGIESLEDKVLKEKELNSKLRGSREKKMFEDPE